MIQSQWPGFARAIDTAPYDAAPVAGGDTAQTALAAPGSNRPDGLVRPWWTCGTGAAGGTGGGMLGDFWNGGRSDGSLASMVASLIERLQQLVGGFIGQNAAETGAQQRFSNVDVSSTGDPHLAAVGTRLGPGGETAVNDRFDSMTGHDDLVHTSDIEGGYRVSTAVTQPDANGVTSNQSASVHANYGWDEITLNRDGSYAISDDGEAVRLAAGGSARLSGGETVTRNQDGSLTVSAANGNGGTIATTLHATGAGVDVTTHAHDLAVGGDVVNHSAETAHPRHTLHHPGHGHGHPHHRHPVAAAAPAPVP